MSYPMRQVLAKGHAGLGSFDPGLLVALIRYLSTRRQTAEMCGRMGD